MQSTGCSDGDPAGICDHCRPWRDYCFRANADLIRYAQSLDEQRHINAQLQQAVYFDAQRLEESYTAVTRTLVFVQATALRNAAYNNMVEEITQVREAYHREQMLRAALQQRAARAPDSTPRRASF